MPSSARAVVAGRLRQPGRRLARRGSASSRALLDDAGTSVVVDHHASNPGFGDVRLVDGGAPATVTLVAGLLDELGVDARPAAGHLPLRRAGRRHRLLPVRQHPARHPRARRPAAGHRHRPLRRSAGGCSTPRRSAGSACSRRSPAAPCWSPRSGAGLVWTWSSTAEARRARPARRAARGAGRRRPLHRRRPTSPACSRARTTAPGRSRCAPAAAPTSPGSPWRSAAAATRWPPATAPTSTARRRSRRCARELSPRRPGRPHRRR